MPDRGDDGAGAIGGGRAQGATGSPCATPRSRPHRDGSPPCFLSDISGRSLSLVGSPPRRPATERPARAACWPPSPIPVSRMPDRGDDGAGAGRAAARPQIEPPRSGVAAPVGGSVKMTLGVSAVLSL